MGETKSWYASRTVWASLVGIGLSTAALVGVRVEAIDGEGLVDALMQVAAAVSSVLAIVGRLAATAKIG